MIRRLAIVLTFLMALVAGQEPHPRAAQIIVRPPVTRPE